MRMTWRWRLIVDGFGEHVEAELEVRGRGRWYRLGIFHEAEVKARDGASSHRKTGARKMTLGNWNGV